MRKGGKSQKSKRKEEKLRDKKSALPAEAAQSSRSIEIVVPQGKGLLPVQEVGESVIAGEVRDLGVIGVKMLAHLVAVIFFVVLGVVAHYLIRDTLGDPKVFDRIPTRYAIDLGDIAIVFALVIRLIWYILKGETKEA